MSTEQGADAPAVDIDAIERLAKDVIQWPIDPEVRRALRSDQADFIAAIDPSTVLAIVDENRRLREERDAAIKRNVTILEIANRQLKSEHEAIHLRVNAEAENRRLREALSAFMNETILTVADGKYWRCVSDACLGLVTSKSRDTLAHRGGCPVTAAEKALRIGGEARDNGGDEVRLTNV